MTKILHVSGATTWRGGEQQAVYLIEELAKKTFCQMLFAPVNAPIFERIQTEGIEKQAYPKKRAVSLSMAIRLRKLCRQFKPDIIHCHDSHAHTLSYTSALIGNKTPIVISRRVDFPVSPSLFSKAKYNSNAIAAYICVSKAIKDVLSISIKEKKKIHLVYSGINLNRFENKENTNILRNEFNIPIKNHIIANIAAIAPHKDYYTFVDTAQILLSSGFPATFLIIGDGPEAEHINNYVASKNLKENIVFTGFRNDIPEILPEIDCMLVTSKTEGLGTSIIDALSAGTPVVATQAGGIPEIITDHENGLLSPCQNPEHLSKNIETLFANQTLRNQLIENGKLRASEFSKENMARKTAAIYEAILQNQATSTA